MQIIFPSSSVSASLTGSTAFPPRMTAAVAIAHATPGAGALLIDTGQINATGLYAFHVVIGMLAANDFFIEHRNAANAATLEDIPCEVVTAGGQIQLDVVFNLTAVNERVRVIMNGAGALAIGACIAYGAL